MHHNIDESCVYRNCLELSKNLCVSDNAEEKDRPEEKGGQDEGAAEEDSGGGTRLGNTSVQCPLCQCFIKLIFSYAIHAVAVVWHKQFSFC